MSEPARARDRQLPTVAQQLLAELLATEADPALSPDQIAAFLPDLHRIRRALPLLRLSPDEQRKINGLLFWEGRSIADEVGYALSGHPADFADVHEDPADLRLQQQRSDGYFALATLLRELAEVALAHSYVCQADRTARALRVVQQVRAAAAAPYPTFDEFTAARRETALLGAEELLRRRNDRLKKGKAKKATGTGS